ncbi:hypothetical protein E2C01_024613 [Portunus trituberculatus]|uniref:Uncharacterized protein n=1 Tax=Portunus trituberculatus TaxID=210409 RepID=A0A5B7EDB9_PORTR|nr:hypothetical protein [Portunus trituberculatus]
MNDEARITETAQKTKNNRISNAESTDKRIPYTPTRSPPAGIPWKIETVQPRVVSVLTIKFTYNANSTAAPAGPRATPGAPRHAMEIRYDRRSSMEGELYQNKLRESS